MESKRGAQGGRGKGLAKTDMKKTTKRQQKTIIKGKKNKMKELILAKKQSIEKSQKSIVEQTINNLSSNLSEDDLKKYRESSPLLANASKSELENIIKQALASEAIKSTVNLLSKAKANERFDFKEISKDFLANYQSEPTKKAYQYGLNKLSEYVDNQHNILLSWKLKDAQKYARAIVAGYSVSTANLIINVCGAFFGYLTAHELIRTNPMYKIKRAKRTTTPKAKELPELKEIKDLIKRLNVKGSKDIAQAIKIMAFAGVRVGGLVDSYVTRNNEFVTFSKGKDFRATLPKEVTGLLNRKLFQGYEAGALSRRINHKLSKLFKQGKTPTKCTCHTFRHYFAVTQYKKNKDIEKLRILLNHSDISTTQIYLAGLNIFID